MPLASLLSSIWRISVLVPLRGFFMAAVGAVVGAFVTIAASLVSSFRLFVRLFVFVAPCCSVV